MRKFVVFLSGILIFTSVFANNDAIDSRMAAEILSRINHYRASHGLPPLKMDETISREARVHSREMAVHAVPFGHDGFRQRMSHLMKSVPDTAGGAENVAYNYKTAKVVTEGWINSTGHRHNILGNYNLTGIGIVRDRAGKLYYTQLFVHTDPRISANRHGHGSTRQRHGHPSRGLFLTWN